MACSRRLVPQRLYRWRKKLGLGVVVHALLRRCRPSFSSRAAWDRSTAIDDLDVGGLASFEVEDDAKLVVDADAVFAGETSLELLQVVAGRREVLKAGGIIERRQLPCRDPPEVFGDPSRRGSDRRGPCAGKPRRGRRRRETCVGALGAGADARGSPGTRPPGRPRRRVARRRPRRDRHPARRRRCPRGRPPRRTARK